MLSACGPNEVTQIQMIERTKTASKGTRLFYQKIIQKLNLAMGIYMKNYL